MSFQTQVSKPVRALKRVARPTDHQASPKIANNAEASEMLAHSGTGATLWQAMVLASWVTHKVASGQSMTAVLMSVPFALNQAITPSLRGAMQELSYQTQRTLGLSEALVQGLMKRPVDTLEPGILCLFKVVFALLAGDKKDSYPTHTVVDQAVKAVPSILHCIKDKQAQSIRFDIPSHKHTQVVAGFVNAVLRAFLREQITRLQAAQAQPLALWNHPVWWQQWLKRSYPKHWQQMLQANNRQAVMTLRVNRRVLTMEAAQQLLSQHGLKSSRVKGFASALVLSQPVPVQAIPHFDVGWFSVQDAAAQGCADALQLVDGLRVLDACAAPGGKTAHLLEANDIELVAVDADSVRLVRVENTLQRISSTIPASTMSRARLLHADVGDLAQWWDGQLFDRILLDAPCSASGVVRRHPDIRWLRRESDINDLQKQQARLLAALWETLKPQGLFLYVTCSVFPQEGEQQIQNFCLQMNSTSQQVRRLPSLGHLLNVDAANNSATLAVSPADSGVDITDTEISDHDGFYYALLQKVN